MAGRIRVLIVDDHAMVRRGMRDFLDLHDDLEVVGEAADGAAALEATAELAPDVVVMDLLMPGMDGIAATAEIKARHPAVEVVAITSFVEEDRIAAAIEAGASGVLLKDAEADDLAAGDPRGARRRGLLRSGGGRDRRPAAADRRGPGVGGGPGRGRARRSSPRASATSSAASPAGCRTGRSPRTLGMAERTARTHVSNILSKLGLTSRTQAALFAVEHRLDRGR